MVLKLSTLKFPFKLPPCRNLPARYFSTSSATTIQLDDLQPHPNPDDFQSKIQFLRNNLYPDSLLRVLDQTQDLNSALNIFKWAALQKRFNHTADTYYHIILKLGFAGNIKELDNFCLNLARDKCVGAEEAFASLIDTFVKRSCLNEATRVLVHMISGGYTPSINVFNHLLGALVNQKTDFQQVLFVYKEMVKAGVFPTVDTLNSLLEVLFETNRVELGLDQFRRMRKKGCNPNARTFEIVIRGLIVNGKLNDAVLILHEMLDLGCRPELSFYTCILPLMCQENKLEEGVQLFRLMRASNLVPDSLICRNLIRCLCINLHLDDATNILREIIEIGENPPVDSFVDIVNAFCEGESFSEAIHFLENNCADLTSPYNSLLDRCCKAGNFFLGKSQLEKMSERGIADCDSWNILIRWICENVGIKKAYELLGSMIVRSLVPDSGTYAALLLGNCKLNKYDEALELFYYIRSKFWVLDSTCYSRLVEGLCRLEKIKEAVEVYSYMSKSGCSLEITTFNMLIRAICDVGKVDEAIKLRQLAYHSGTSCTSLTYTTIMLALHKSQRAKDVLVILSQMLIGGCAVHAEAYCILIRSMTTLNRFKDCASFLKLMLDEGLIPDSETLHDLFSCLASHSQLHLVSKDIDEIISRSENLDLAMYSLLIEGLWKEGCKSEARLLLDLMLERGLVPDATIHTLLIGSNVKEVTSSGTTMYANSMEQDNVSNILAEGLGK
ncbi:hypothetical protein COLO4_05513 [Corchorus olitorius]|uniref:Pentacotripeptide-repeat region of PRORP domain-containing protein n=1 Tax=Corchorus olitorius TaxID=93759 RepID=A0A1R3KQQ6_9ROSI|nr:hypothetical protein COLO4_05513 [Corchorus olitorius]